MLDRTIYAECKIYGQHYTSFVEYWIKFIDVFLQTPTRMLILIVQSHVFPTSFYKKKKRHHSKKKYNKLERKTTYTH